MIEYKGYTGFWTSLTPAESVTVPDQDVPGTSHPQIAAKATTDISPQVGHCQRNAIMSGAMNAV